MEEIIRKRITKLEKDLEQCKKKITPDGKNTVKYAVEVEKIKFAINQLYVCLGSE